MTADERMRKRMLKKSARKNAYKIIYQAKSVYSLTWKRERFTEKASGFDW